MGLPVPTAAVWVASRKRAPDSLVRRGRWIAPAGKIIPTATSKLANTESLILNAPGGQVALVVRIDRWRARPSGFRGCSGSHSRRSRHIRS